MRKLLGASCLAVILIGACCLKQTLERMRKSVAAANAGTVQGIFYAPDGRSCILMGTDDTVALTTPDKFRTAGSLFGRISGEEPYGVVADASFSCEERQSEE